jgi:hypothetical protein
MLHTKFLTVIAAFAAVSLSALSLNAKVGGDHFKVYLNNKLIIEQYIGGAIKINLQQLQLDKANVNDKLTFHYSHCGEIGRSRKIAVTDAKGKVIREWKFADASGKQSGMVIPVKELMELKQEGLQFVYSAQQLPKGQALAALHLTDRSTGWLPAATGWIVKVMLGGWSHAA